jgi:Cu+-exporting ATPase
MHTDGSATGESAQHDGDRLPAFSGGANGGTGAGADRALVDSGGANGGSVVTDAGLATRTSARITSGANAVSGASGPARSADDADRDSHARTRVHVAENVAGSLVRLGVIELADTIKPDSVTAVRVLHDRRLRTVLLTGDHRDAANAIARQVGIDDVRADVLPSGKADAIRELQAGGRNVAMVGDGVNDAPALAQANLGIAIGSGSDIAMETGDIVLVSGSLHGIVTAIGLSRATMRCIRQNLFFAFLYNVLAIPLAATGLLSPLIAAGAMALSDVTVLGNALRLRRTKID